MADLDQLHKALINADAAGDTEAATALAAEIKKINNENMVASRSASPASAINSAVDAFKPQIRPGSTPQEELAQETGPMAAATIGAGKTGSDILSGAKQLLLGGISKFAPQPWSTLADAQTKNLSQEQAQQKAIYDPLRTEHPIATGIGEGAPYVAVPASMGVLPAALTVGGLEGLKYGTPEERAKRAAIGAGTTAIGGLIGNQVGNVISPVKSDTLSQTQRQALAKAIDMGIQPRRSQLTQSGVTNLIEDWAARTPGGKGVMEKFNRSNQAAINKEAAQSIWQIADELSPQVFSKARTAIGQPFEDIKALPGRIININKDVGTAADDIIRIQSKLPKEMQSGDALSLAEQAKRMSSLNARIDGEAYQLIRSRLSDASNSAFEGNNAVAGKAYQRLLNALDDSAERSLMVNGFDTLAERLRRARPAYANLKTLERGLVAEGGNVSPQRLAQALRSNNEQAFREGVDSPLLNIGRYGESFKPLQQGSQTYERSLFNNPVASVVSAPFAYTAAKATTSPIMNAFAKQLALNPNLAKAAEQAGLVGNTGSRAMAAELLKQELSLIGINPNN